ncbi:4-oxalomesaconate tautomerase [Rhodoligotrophos defluvii]|uniref:4-oxalomesaconate tautomerase n=1 Tax=Rhodoligotrophos defluvii TaxID=2561934 RepID=UPI0010C997C3|nr:4-oxalomesaconate tautomerase [Rhodoligotrophos defluvii]
MKLAVDQIRIPCVMMRGGTSRGAFFNRNDLPADPAMRDAVLVAAMGSGNPLQVDGIGGGNPLTSKVAIVSVSEREDADLDYLFAQVNVERAQVDTKPNCGNMLAAVGPYALEAGLVEAQSPRTSLRIYNVNTDAVIEAMIETPDGIATYKGDCRIDGVAGTGAPVRLNFSDSEGAVTGALLPTGHIRDVIDGVETSVVDYAVPVMFVRAEDLGLDGNEPPAVLTANRAVFDRMEALRLEAGRRAGLGDVSGSVVPKIAVVARPRGDGVVLSRYFTPRTAHESYPVTGGLCLAVASCLDGSVVHELVREPVREAGIVGIEHPVGKLEIEIELRRAGANRSPIARASLVRTARRLFDGFVYVPRQVVEAVAAPVPSGLAHQSA